GVTEGNIGTERIIKMLSVVDDQLVVEAKGIYSIEKFLIARRLMYWQVYFHKTVIASEYLLANILKRVRYLEENGKDVFATPALKYFVKNRIDAEYFSNNDKEVIAHFIQLDDNDIMASAKEWLKCDDIILVLLANSLLNRKLPATNILDKPCSPELIEGIVVNTAKHFKVSEEDARFLISHGEINNNTYSYKGDSIRIQQKNGEISDIADISDVLNGSFLNKTIKKYFICYPKIVAYADNH
ncbi:MAG: phosphohydrolase, partial [Bacteroidales bacterium]|nr:phosphohydrolase [Bacteroidales bacterium]